MNIDLIHASYHPHHSIQEKQILDKYGLEFDPELSQEKQRLYRNPATQEIFIVYPGTQDWQDVGYDLYHMFGQESNHSRFGKIRKWEKQVRDKYGEENVTVLGHSLGGAIADRSIFSKRVTYNKLVAWNGLRREDITQEQQDHRIVGDIASQLAPYQKNTKSKSHWRWSSLLGPSWLNHSLKQFR